VVQVHLSEATLNDKGSRGVLVALMAIRHGLGSRNYEERGQGLDRIGGNA